MTKEDKELLLKDLSARFSYGVKVKVHDTEYGDFDSYVDGISNTSVETNPVEEQTMDFNPFVLYSLQDIKPYLRPMSSITISECTQLNVLLPRYFIVTPECLACLDHINGGIINFEVLDTIIDFYNSHHLDWRGLIPKGLALEAPKDMYKI